MRTKLIWSTWSVAVAFFVGFGLWAFLDPGSFFERVAGFPPYNRHFLRDAGAFQLGIGAALVAGAFISDALAATLCGASAAALAHAVSHVVDRDLGGRSADHVLLWALAAVLVAATVARVSRRQE
jgi:hypothetical protein